MNWHQKKINLVFTDELQLRIAAHASAESHFCILQSNNFQPQNNISPEKSYPFLAGIGLHKEISVSENPLSDLQALLNENQKSWFFGHLSYDMKNNIEKNLDSSNPGHIGFPLLTFFIPKIVIAVQQNEITVWFTEENKLFAENFLENISSDKRQLTFTDENKIPEFTFQKKQEYIQQIEKIKYHLHRGDIYEMNYCIPFHAENTTIHPLPVWKNLTENSPAPFSSFYRINNHWLMCASPERFLKKENNKILSQPIKGTSKRSTDPVIDLQLKKDLLNNEKERAENVMIVDLVRNDLSRVAAKGSVHVDELFGIYSFPHVYQMISTVSAQLKSGITFTDILKSLFPMGSMTGAPKIRAMELIEELENFKRGLFSGSIGYINPEGDFDFNVVIRSILYNSKTLNLLIAAGSAITAKSNPEMEYDECLLKAQSLLKTLGYKLPVY